MKNPKLLTICSTTLLLAISSSSYAEQTVARSDEISQNSKNEVSQNFSKFEPFTFGFSQIAKKAMPATVFIKSTINPQPFSGSEFPSPLDPFGDDFFRHFFGFPNNNHNSQPFPQQPQQIAGGSGFFISQDGYIVTNNHVIKDASQITVVLKDGREFSATVKGSDAKTDLAVLKIEETNLPYLSFGDSDGLEIGEWVAAIGSPFALESSLTVGVVSAKSRQDLGITSLEDFIQTDAAINPGNSGGPLLNLEGQVIGVNTAIMSRTGGYMGIGFSIPSHIVQHVIEQILNDGGVKRAYLGVVLQPIDSDLADALALEKQDGVLVSDIVKDSPAMKGGLQQGDIILEYNGKPVKSVSKLRNDIALMNPDQMIKLKVLRNNNTINIEIPLGMQKDTEMALADLTQKIGMEIENISPELATRLSVPTDTSGVVIMKVLPNSPAHMAGLKPGFLITGVAMQGNHPKAVRNTAEFDEALKEAGQRNHVIFIVRHQNFQRYYTLKIK